MPAPKLTPEIQRRIVRSIRLGASSMLAAQGVGVHLKTLQRWRRWGRRGKEPYVQFVAAVTEAEKQCLDVLLHRIRKASKEDWRAAAFLLERRFPLEFANERRLIQTLTGQVQQLQEQLHQVILEATTRVGADRSQPYCASNGKTPAVAVPSELATNH